MDRILQDWRGGDVEVYMDEIVIHAKGGQKHDELFDNVIRRISDKGLNVNPKKIQFRKCWLHKTSLIKNKYFNYEANCSSLCSSYFQRGSQLGFLQLRFSKSRSLFAQEFL
ncbi:hypothetical protein NGRA_2809 [Nosema granulosis]|uniref:Reverse transcriptase domain-containing protein n=1 Tax=Nosema granulosis TaxID=83296 RepID=A0A9P6GX11_9MICR|nr:hypothetical protein NGRA_2809 [Nosema granulosis]